MLCEKIYTTFRELFNSVIIGSVHEILPKINKYNEEIAKFVEDINAKCGITLICTQLEISELKHWAETFLVAVNTCSQSGQQQPQVPQTTVAIPSPKVNLCSRVVSAEEPCRVNESAAYYNTVDRSGSSHHCSTPNMSPVPPGLQTT